MTPPSEALFSDFSLNTHGRLCFLGLSLGERFELAQLWPLIMIVLGDSVRLESLNRPYMIPSKLAVSTKLPKTDLVLSKGKSESQLRGESKLRISLGQVNQ